MKVKTYTVDNMQDAMTLIKNDLGRDAVILHTRKLRTSGFLGFFRKERIEVVAAVESREAREARESVKSAKAAAALSPALKNQASPFVPLAQTLSSPGSEPTIAPAPSNSIEAEVKELRSMIEQVLSSLPQNKPINDEAVNTIFQQILCQNDVEQSIVQQLLEGLPAHGAVLGQNQEQTKQLILHRLRLVADKIDPIMINRQECKIVALIGPTGVGKTTTVAKIAANFALKEGFKVAMITADTYRIAAVEQLKTYADIIGVSLDIVYTPSELQAAIARHFDKHLILIDTAGRSPSNLDQLQELKNLLAVDSSIEKHLVLSATTKYKDALEVVERFSICSPHKFIFTKVDEASNLGTVFNLLYRYPMKFSYITTGQNVPDDIEIANADKLAEQLLRD